MLNPELVKTMVKNSGSKLFNITFEKKNGEIREVPNCQLVDSPETHKNHGVLFSVINSQTKDYATARFTHVLRLAACNQVLQDNEYDKSKAVKKAV